MTTNTLTDAEQALFDDLPGPPAEAVIKSTNIWIIEWLTSGDLPTGRLLHEWMQSRRPGWSAYFKCESKQDVLSAIEHATNLARNSRMSPVLHFEAHGNENGLGREYGDGHVEFLEWNEITKSLQKLNLVTRCNLVIVVAACIGFAGIKALVQGPRAPAVALVGPDASIMSDNLLSATKEFYSRWMAPDPRLRDIVLNASHVAGETSFEWEPFAVLAFDSLAKLLIVSMRPDQQRIQINRLRQRMLEETKLSSTEIECRLTKLTPSLQATFFQHLWDTMFMIDLYPENRERFGVNWIEIVNMALQNRHEMVENGT